MESSTAKTLMPGQINVILVFFVQEKAGNK